MKALFVAFEGLPGSGKSTIIRCVYQCFAQDGIKIFVYGMGVSPQARQIKRAADMLANDDPARFLLFWSLRLQQARAIQRACANVGIVLADRFWGTTYAVDRWGHGVPLKVLEWLKQHVPINPHITFLLDVPVAVAVQRKRFSRAARDLSAMERIRCGYRVLAREMQWVVVDAAQDEKTVCARCCDTISLALSRRS